MLLCSLIRTFATENQKQPFATMLFQKNIIKKYIALLDEQLLLTAWQQYQSYFLNAEIQQNILHSKEEQFQEGFLRELFVNVQVFAHYGLTAEEREIIMEA